MEKSPENRGNSRSRPLSRSKNRKSSKNSALTETNGQCPENFIEFGPQSKNGYNSFTVATQKRNRSRGNRFDSPLTLKHKSIVIFWKITQKSHSYTSNIQVKPQTHQFYQRLQHLIRKKKLDHEINLSDVRDLIYRELDDLITYFEDIELGKLLGKGASSEVYFGNYKYCYCAVKKIKLSMMNSKQIVMFFLNLRNS